MLAWIAWIAWVVKKMHRPSRDEFIALSRKGNLIPVYREILADMETPVSAFKKLDKNGYSFLLESVEVGEKLGRYSFLGSKPFLVLFSKGERVTIETNPPSPLKGESWGKGGINLRECRVEEFRLRTGEDPLHVLKRLLQEYKFVTLPDLPRFCGGAVGYMGYDMVLFFERLPVIALDDLQLPDCCFMFTDTVLIFDHVKRKLKVLANAHVDGNPEDAYDSAVERIEAVIHQLRMRNARNEPNSSAGTQECGDEREREEGSTSNFTQEQFESVVCRAKDYIVAGDVIQVVLSQRFSKWVQADTFDIYRALRSVNPSPYMYYLTFGDLHLIGSSPEILVTCEDGRVVTRPLAGTRPRGATPDEDERLKEELLTDEKERAEHIMLVDLGRNDIGRVCKVGSVKVTELMEVEKYSHVMHIYSHVVGELDPRFDRFDVLRAAFPAGTVSGAPKIRAMEIIEELEPTRRGPYAGAVGYFSFSGNMDTAICIRTVVVKGNQAYVQAGAGIVADSVPQREYQETVNKAKALMKAIQWAEEGLE